MFIIGELINGMYADIGRAIKEKDKSIRRKRADKKANHTETVPDPAAKAAAKTAVTGATNDGIGNDAAEQTSDRAHQKRASLVESTQQAGIGQVVLLLQKLRKVSDIEIPAISLRGIHQAEHEKISIRYDSPPRHATMCVDGLRAPAAANELQLGGIDFRYD